MGPSPSRIERYEIYDDRDDYDECCGCGPWYGGPVYREARARWLPGFGSPRYNYFGLGGYAGTIVPGGGVYRAAVAPVPAPVPVPVPLITPPPPAAVVGIGPAEVVPAGPPMITPARPGYISMYEGGCIDLSEYIDLIT